MLLNTIAAVLVVGISGVVIGYLLSVASHYFAVETDEMTQKIREELPGANCGGCGYSGCQAYAEAIKAGAPVNLCAAGGQPVAEKIATITGRDAGKVENRKAFVYCSGGGSERRRYEFFGIDSCIPACRVDGGPLLCSFACVGMGSCTKVCKFNAISIQNGVAVVDPVLCTGCGSCAAECPKGIIGMIPADQQVNIPCRSHLKAKETREACEFGCLGCKLCEKNCPQQAITVTDSLATLDPAKCIGCGRCVEVCPRKLVRVISGKALINNETESVPPQAAPVEAADNQDEGTDHLSPEQIPHENKDTTVAAPMPAPEEIAPKEQKEFSSQASSLSAFDMIQQEKMTEEKETAEAETSPAENNPVAPLQEEAVTIELTDIGEEKQ